MQGTLAFGGTLEATSIFYNEYPEWLWIQLFWIFAAAAEGVAVALAFTPVVGIVVGAVLTVLFGLVGIVYIPERRERVIERRSA